MLALVNHNIVSVMTMASIKKKKKEKDKQRKKRREEGGRNEQRQERGKHFYIKEEG